MPARYLDYYTRLASRVVPFLSGRRIAIEQRFPGENNLVYRRHAGGSQRDSWIRVSNNADLIDWARQYAEGLHAHIRSDTDGAWFVIDIDSRELPTQMAQLAAGHAADVLRAQGLEPLVKFSGSDGFHLMWDVPDLASASDAELWELERAVVRSVACEVERRLLNDKDAVPIREAVGKGRPLITTANADTQNRHALLFDEYILKDSANFRVPYSIHPHTGLVTVPLPPDGLAGFRPEQATPEAVATAWPEVPLPVHSIAAVRAAVASWSADGC